MSFSVETPYGRGGATCVQCCLRAASTAVTRAVIVMPIEMWPQRLSRLCCLPLDVEHAAAALLALHLLRLLLSCPVAVPVIVFL